MLKSRCSRAMIDLRYCASKALLYIGSAEDARNDRSECQESRLRIPIVRQKRSPYVPRVISVLQTNITESMLFCAISSRKHKHINRNEVFEFRFFYVILYYYEVATLYIAILLRACRGVSLRQGFVMPLSPGIFNRLFNNKIVTPARGCIAI